MVKYCFCLRSTERRKFLSFQCFSVIYVHKKYVREEYYQNTCGWAFKMWETVGSQREWYSWNYVKIWNYNKKHLSQEDIYVIIDRLSSSLRKDPWCTQLNALS